MTILDKFLILFESDADEAAKDVNDLDKTLDSVEKSSKEATKAAQSFSDATKDMSADAKLAATDLVKLSKKDVVKSDQIDGLRKLSKEFKNLSKKKAADLGKKIGLTPKQVKNLRDGEKGIQKLSKELKKVKKPAENTALEFTNIGKKALGAAGATVALAGAVAGFISTTGRIDELGKFANLIDENVSDINAWEGAVNRAGGTSDGFRGSIESLNEKMIDASVKGFNEITPFFNQLGISIVDTNGKVKSTLSILPELAGAFDRIGKQKALGIGKKLGFDAGTIALLQQGTGAIDKLIKRQKRLGLVNNEAAKMSAEFVDIMADLKQISGFAAQGLLVNFIPAVNWTINKLIELSIWARENKPIVYGFFAGLTVVAIPALLSLASAAWAVVAPFLIMAAPFLAIAAAAGVVGVAIALVIEDIMAFVNGQDSLLGDIAKKWPVVGDIVRAVVDDVKVFVEMMKDFAGFLFNIFANPEKALKSLKGALGNVKSFFGLDKETDDKTEDNKPKTLDKVKSFFGFGNDDESAIELNKNLNIGQESLALATNNPIASQTSNSIQNSTKSLSRSTSVQTGDIIVQTQATDTKSIAADISGSLQEEMRTTIESFDDGLKI